MKNPSVGTSCVIAAAAAAGVTALIASGPVLAPVAQAAAAQSSDRTPADRTPADRKPADSKPTDWKPTDWKHWGGDTGVSRYSPIAQITADNVSRLKPVWV